MRKVKGMSYRILIFIIFLVATLAFSGSVSAIELAYDDGTCGLMNEIHGPNDSGPQQLRQRFLLGDFGLSAGDLVGKNIKVRIHWGSASSGTDFAGEIKIYEGDVIELTQSFVNPPLSAWQDFDFPEMGLMGFSGDEFYVEVLWTSGWGYICEDTNTPIHNMSEVDPGTGNWYPLPEGANGDLLIRVDVRERPLGALPVSQCLNLFESETEPFSARVSNDFDGCIIEASATFYKSSNCTGDPITPSWDNPDPNVVYKSGTRGGCAEAVEVTKSSPACVQVTLKSGRKTTVCY
jgi:hypothetical protein